MQSTVLKNYNLRHSYLIELEFTSKFRTLNFFFNLGIQERKIILLHEVHYIFVLTYDIEYIIPVSYTHLVKSFSGR